MRNGVFDNSLEQWARTASGIKLHGWRWNGATLRQERTYLGCTLAILRTGSQSYNAVLIDPAGAVVKNERQGTVADAALWLMEQTTELMFKRLVDDVYQLRLEHKVTVMSVRDITDRFDTAVGWRRNDEDGN